MTSISATQYNPYSTLASTYPATSGSTTSQSTIDTGATAGSDSATYISLSQEAQSALAAKDFATVTADVRAKLDSLLADAGLSSPYKDGALAINLSDIDRRSLFAVASNSEGQFSADEQSAASAEMTRRFDVVLVGPAAVARVTNDLRDLYAAAADYMDAASSEEKTSDLWQTQRAALTEASIAVSNDPGGLPDILYDPAADYLIKVETGEVGQPQPFGDVASDVRIVLDKQKADAEALGNFGSKPDFSLIGSRSLAAIALNEGNQFTNDEVLAAKADMRSRSGATLLASFEAARDSGDPTSLAKNILSAYSSLSVEERAAAGWSEGLYETALSHYESSSRLAQMFGEASSGGASNGNTLSFLDYL